MRSNSTTLAHTENRPEQDEILEKEEEEEESKEQNENILVTTVPEDSKIDQSEVLDLNRIDVPVSIQELPVAETETKLSPLNQESKLIFEEAHESSLARYPSTERPQQDEQKINASPKSEKKILEESPNLSPEQINKRNSPIGRNLLSNI